MHALATHMPLSPGAGLGEQAQAFGSLLAAYWPVLAVSLGVSLVMTPLCRAIALKLGVVDRPDDWLKPHHKPIPYLGGVAIFAGWGAGLLFAMLFFGSVDSSSSVAGSAPVIDLKLMIGVFIAGALIMSLGLADDLSMMAPKVKLAGNIVVAALLLCFGLGDEIIKVLTSRVGVGFDSSEWWLVLAYSVPITVFFVVGACNATNLIDGVDGLCGGVLAIISVGFLILAMHLHCYRDWNAPDGVRVVLAMAMLGGALGFLPFNRNPAKIFMGDAGSMLLGLNAAMILLLFGEEGRFRWMLASVVIFGLPVADMLLTLARRWRAQRPLMMGDRSHFYDQLIDRGIGVRRVVLISYVLTGGFVLMGLLPTCMRMRHFLVVYGMAGALLLYFVHKYRMVRVDGPGHGEGVHNEEDSES